MSTLITAERGRIWRALTTPSELIRWDDQLVALLDPAPDYPQLGQKVRWRYRVGSVPIVVHQTIQEVQPGERLQSTISRGVFCFDEMYTLADEVAQPDRTRLSLRVVASNSTPVVDGTMDRFEIRRLSAELIDARLRAVQKWCENHV
ncbi:MAG: SRPBCC domain-containing protein [Myxococcales bacterium]|nr:SRPBCC domain-containing protein [Myxococcales bacterium]